MAQERFSFGENSFVFLCSPGGKILYSSPELDRLLGKEMKDQHFYDHLDQEEIAQLLEAMQGQRVRMQCTIESMNFFLVAEKNEQGMRIELYPLDPPAEPFMDPVSGQFFARELAGYLAAMLPAAQRLVEKAPAELQTEAGVILRNAFCQMRLQRDMVDLLAIQSGEMRLFAAEEDMGDLLEELADEVRPYCEALNIQVRCQVPEDLVLCWVDKQRVRRMLYQLVSNSIKAQPQSGQIVLSLKDRKEEVSITISDTGCGIPTEELEQVFRKYTTGDPAGTRSGVGLGLPLARQIAQLHGGRLLIVSNETGGTAVSVTLPKKLRGEAASLGMAVAAYSGGFDPAKLELSTVLPSIFYQNDIRAK